jgi:hypothetical protein
MEFHAKLLENSGTSAFFKGFSNLASVAIILKIS